MSIAFDPNGAVLSEASRGTLNSLAQRLTTDSSLQVQLNAYAEGDDDGASKAKRLSLSRALAARSFLIEKGVNQTRIEVRALGNKVPSGPADRVDIVAQKR